MFTPPFDNEIDQLLTQAEALLQDEKPVEALALLDRAHTLEPTHAWTLLFRGVALGQLGRLEEAIDQLLSAADRSQEDIDIQVDTARYLSLLEQHQDALICANRAVAIDEMDGGAQAVRAEVLERLGRIPEAVPSREAALALDPDDSDSRYYLALDLSDMGRHQEAYETALPLFTEYADDPEIIRLHGACLSYIGEHEQSLALWAELERLEGVNPNILHNRASTLSALGRHDEALATINDAITNEPDAAINYYTRGLIHEHLHREDTAIVDYLAALSRDPEHLDAVINLVEVAPSVQATPVVLEQIDVMLESAPTSAKLLYARGRLLMEQGDFLGGRQAIEEALNREPALGVGWYTLSMLYGVLNDYQAAVEAADRALQEFPDDAGLWLNRGQAQHELKQFPEAMASYDKAAELAPTDWMPWLHLGRLLLLDLERPGDARAVLQESLRLYPSNEHTLWMLALSLLRLGKTQDAEPLLTQLLSLAPDHLWGRLTRAAFHAQTGGMEDAFVDLAVVSAQGYDISLLVNEPLFTPIWPDPRFSRLVRGKGRVR